MKFNKFRLIVITGMFLLALGLSGCAAAEKDQSHNNKPAETVKTVNQQRYQQALKDLKHGADRQAYHQLQRLVKSGAATKKQRQLQRQVRLLLQTKKALATVQLDTAGKALAQLSATQQPVEIAQQVKALKKELSAAKLAQVYYQEVIAYYQAGKYDAAGGSYQALQALSRKYQAVATLQDKSAEYGKLISQKQAAATTTAAASTSSSAVASSGYTNARNSKIANSEYEQKTGSSLAGATNSQVSSVVQSLTDSQVLAKFWQASQIPQEAGDQYYVKQLNDQNYQIEIRHTSPSNAAVSNLKGMYQFDVATNVVTKLNEITGEYVRIN